VVFNVSSGVLVVGPRECSIAPPVPTARHRRP